MIYFDSSAFVKRYLKEIGTDVVNSLIFSSRIEATSKLSYPEILSAFARKHRANEIRVRLFFGDKRRCDGDRVRTDDSVGHRWLNFKGEWKAIS